MNNYNSIFIRDTFVFGSIKKIYDNKVELEQIKEILLLIPSFEDLSKTESMTLLKLFAPKLKEFIESKEKKTLITQENVLNILVKEDKRSNFFKFLAKNNKNIIVFAEDEYEKYVKTLGSNYLYLVLGQDEWLTSLGMFDRFKDIKIAIQNTHNPFKNPKNAYSKYILEKN